MRDRTAVPGTSQTESPHFNSYHTVVNTKPHDYLSVHEFVRNSFVKRRGFVYQSQAVYVYSSTTEEDGRFSD